MATSNDEPTGRTAISAESATAAGSQSPEPAERAEPPSHPADGDSKPGRLRRLLSSGWTIGIGAAIFGAIVGGVVSAFFISNPHLLPNIESGAKPKRTKGPPKPVFNSEVVESNGTWEYATTEFTPSRRVRLLPYDAPLKIVAYCIGQPTHNERTNVIDERWLILTDGHAVPAPVANFPSALVAAQPRRCPGAGGRIAGPQSIHLYPRPTHRDLLLSAVAGGATSVGFAVFALGGHRWRSVALALANDKRFSARVPLGGAVVAMAVACWAARTPARPNGRAVYDAEPLEHKPSQSFVDAVAQLPAGIPAACSHTTYGAEQRVTKRKTSSLSQQVIYAETTSPHSTRIEPYPRTTSHQRSVSRPESSQEGPVIHHPEE
jgi:hypothetical protein